MALPVNLEQLLSGQVVEWARLEFKRGWNEEAAIHTICAFANDLDNWGGGYLIIGVAEKDGQPDLPPAGLQPAQADAIQKRLIELCHQLTPTYFPLVEPEEYLGKLVLVIWAPGGENRPYKAPVSLAKDNKAQKEYYVRHFASTTRANPDEQRRLLDLTAKVPFDDRINHQATLDDLSLGLIREHLREIKSKLAGEAVTIPFEALCRQMRIVSGPPEYCKPLNIGLLMFNEQPESFFPGAFIDVVIHSSESGRSRSLVEKRFSGPLPQQLRQALSFLQTQVLKETTRKIPGQAEAFRFFNYPFAALEEALANAVYHRSYELRNAIEVSVRPTQIQILSFPGALPPVTAEQLRNTQPIMARDYRNRRVGDFLKELRLTEGRATGLPDIRAAMEANGSPPPTFEMDADRFSFLTTLKVHPAYTSQSVAAREAEAQREARSKRLSQDPSTGQ
ncbi:RNA-binding domain-containing protein [uncultured Hymenobacter sp.]|uniref:RNA-binding domain-containing protein n=1 Tax=uncultured Hymenobacter sp. TaxID=170016 RepID=UPI0035CBC670